MHDMDNPDDLAHAHPFDLAEQGINTMMAGCVTAWFDTKSGDATVSYRRSGDARTLCQRLLDDASALLRVRDWIGEQTREHGFTAVPPRRAEVVVL